MRDGSVALKNYLAANNVALISDLLTLTTRGGATYRLTNAEVDLIVGGNTFYASSFKRTRIRSAAGVQADTLDIDLQVDPSLLVGGRTYAQMFAEGVFTGAAVLLEALVMPSLGDVSLGAVTMFSGNVADGDPNPSEVRFRVRDERGALDQVIPRHVYTPQCTYQLYDAGCGVVKASHLTTHTVGAGCTTTSLVGLTPATAAAHHVLGWVKFTSGSCAGLRRTVRAVVSGSQVTLATALPQAPANGDSLELVKGCDKTRLVCDARFSNLARFRGFSNVARDS